MTAATLVRRLCRVIADEADRNPQFAEQLLLALDQASRSTENPGEDAAPRRRGARRAPGVVDPFAVYQEGEDELRRRLTQLGVEQIKDIVAEHGMDPSKLALKWRTSDRLVELVVSTVAQRAARGDAFRSS